LRFDGAEELAAIARPDGPWVVLDLYHSFMAMPCDFSAIADRVFLLGGGYKYAMAGEGAAYIHAPRGYGERPSNTGWFAGSLAAALLLNVRIRGQAMQDASPEGLYHLSATEWWSGKDPERTWRRLVHVYIAPSEFARHKLIVGGLPGNRIVVKPNFMSDPGTPLACSRHGALFVGRLSPEKGLQTLVKAWEGIEFPLRILGGGPLRLYLSADLSRWISVLGHRPHAEVGPAMREARFLVMPSEYIEGFPMVIVEAFANGLPVIASRLGTMADVIEDGVTGLHFTAGDPDDLAAKVAWAITHSDRMAEMGSAARRVYETRYSEETNYQSLLTIYRDAISVGAESGKFAGKAASCRH
jgi:hypothetical protein